jgi:2-polyprenyl-3-methyl-5-hydroxy-6-metoxy-1,4-benzoquinol methylase
MSGYYEINYRPFLPQDRHAAILDIGCGQGDFVRYMHSLGYSNITAVDIDRHAIDGLQGLDGV